MNTDITQDSEPQPLEVAPRTPYIEIPIPLMMNLKVDPDWKSRSETSDKNEAKEEETDDNGFEERRRKM